MTVCDVWGITLTQLGYHVAITTIVSVRIAVLGAVGMAVWENVLYRSQYDARALSRASCIAIQRIQPYYRVQTAIHRHTAYNTIQSPSGCALVVAR